MGKAPGELGGGWGAWFLVLTATNSVCPWTSLGLGLGFHFLFLKMHVSMGTWANSSQVISSSWSWVLERGSREGRWECYSLLRCEW